MGRPENPITWDGPVAELARALRELRQRAGQPPYRTMATSTLRGTSVLADAAAGQRCPTWAVTRDFVRACGDDPEAWRPLWERAHKAPRKRGSSAKPVADTSAPTQVTVVRPVPPSEPDPWQATTPKEYVIQLRALRAWTGQTSFYEVRRAVGGRLAQSTMYDALNPNRHRLPPLGIVRAIVTACRADVDRWVQAWQRLRMREHRNTPLPTRPVNPFRERLWEQASRSHLIESEGRQVQPPVPLRRLDQEGKAIGSDVVSLVRRLTDTAGPDAAALDGPPPGGTGAGRSGNRHR